MHRFEEGAGMGRIDLRGDAVAEVEYMTRALTAA
jgi:hypothetical protein